MGKIILFLLLVSVSAYGEELARFPGWKINKIEKAQSADGSYQIGPDYYGLTPPDSRPAVTIDARVAKQLKAGEARPEEVYGRSGGKKEEKAAKAEDVYKPGGGYVHADQISSTLPGYDPRGDQSGISGRASREGYGAAGSVSSYGGGMSADGVVGGNPYGASYSGYADGSSSSSSDSGVITTGPSAGSSGELASSSGSGGAGSAASASASDAADANSASASNSGSKAAAVAATGNGSAASGTNPFGSGLTMANSGLAGFGFDSDSKGGHDGSSGGDDGVGNGSLTDRSLAETDVPPPCERGRYVYSEATYLRLKLPRGCNLIHISAWGAGGGSGTRTSQSGGHDGGGPITVEVPGGGGSFMSTSWQINADKYDLVVVVGATGKKVVQTVTQVKNPGGGDSGTTTQVSYSGGEGGFPGAKNGSGTGGGGGGYSGVFLVSKTDASKTMKPDWAMAIGNGGAGGASGGAGGSIDVKGTAPSATMTNKIGEKAKGQKPGFQYYPERGSAGNPGTSGKVIIEYF